MEEKKAPWERREGESEKAYAAFKEYLDLGDERTISEVVRRLKKSRSLIDRWKDKWDWKNRAIAYDAELDKQDRAKRRKLIKATKDRQLQISYSLEKKALEALNMLEPEEMASKGIIDMLKLAMEIQEKVLIEEPVTTGQAGGTSLADLIISAYDANHGGDE